MMESGQHWRAFGSLFFLLHQGKLLWLLNTPIIGRWFRRVLRISGERSAVGSLKIDRILPNAIFWWYGDKQVAEFRTHAKFSKRLYYAFAPLWWALHAWDWCVADRWVPELSFGFDTLTTYPNADADGGKTTTDGNVFHSYAGGAGVSWATIIASAGNTAYPARVSDTGMYLLADSAGRTNLWRYCVRSIFLFNTSALTSGAVISAAVMSLYGISKVDGLGVTPNMDVYTSTPGSNTTLAASDYAQTGNVSQTGSPVTYASLNAAGYTPFTFNATGMGNISKPGISKFATRNANYDVAGTQPTWTADAESGYEFYYADQTGTTNDPKLVVTYTIGQEGELIGITDSLAILKYQGQAFLRYLSEALGRSDALDRDVTFRRFVADQKGITDEEKWVHAFIRYISDAENRTDAIDRDVLFRRFSADNLGLTDAQLRRVIFDRDIIEALGLTDYDIQARGQQRNLADALGIADSANRYFTAYRRPADSIGLTDALSRRMDFARKLSEAFGITDEEARKVAYDRDVADALGLSDSSVALKLLLRTLSEQLGITDAQIRKAGIRRIFSDTLGYTDAQSRASALVRGLTESLGITDAQARSVAYSRRMTEALGISDYEAVLKLLIRSLAEQLGITDAETRQVALWRVVNEAVGLTDARTRTMALGRILADAEGITDATSRKASFARTLADALGITDQRLILNIISRAIADAVGITDYRDVTKSAPLILRAIADGISIADAIAVSKFAVIIRTIAESLGITDARYAAKAVRRILSEALGITDFEDETKQIRRYLAELVGLADDVEKASTIIRRLTETAGITDAAVAGLSAYIVRIISDQLGLTDRVSKLAAILTWLALAIAVEIPAVNVELAGPAIELRVDKVIREEAQEATIDTEVYAPAIKTEVE